MTVVSKFKFEYFFVGIVAWTIVFALINLAIVDACSTTIVTESRYGAIAHHQYFEFTFKSIIILAVVNIFVLLLYFLLIWRLLKISVSEDEIVIKHLFIGANKRITYDEIVHIGGGIAMNTGHGTRSTNAVSTSVRTRVITLKDGLKISYDNRIYANFDEMHHWIMKYWNKGREK